MKGSSILIRIDNLRYSYPAVLPGGDPVAALRGIDLNIERGEFVAVMGPTGAGKTTLCLALSGLVPHATGGVIRGNVWIADRNTKQANVADLATVVGHVFQDSESQLFNMSVEDEVAFGPETLGVPADEIEHRIEWALDVVGLSDLRQRSPAALSGGQQRRLAIASVLAMRPSVLVLDEPTDGLDPVGRRAVMAVIGDLQQSGTTVVMATQDPDAVAALADRVVVLDAGRVVRSGTLLAVFSQVDHMHSRGLDVPQVTEIGWRLGWQPLPLTLDEAVKRGRGARGNLRELEGTPQRNTGVSCLVSRDSSTGSSNPPAVRMADVWYQYDGVQALSGVDCTIERGDFVALVGANGSGKTTLARHVNRLLLPQHGRVVVLGQDTRSASAGVWARRVGYVFQNPDHQIFAPSVREEVAFGPRNLDFASDEVQRRVEAALKAFDLSELENAPPAMLSYGTRRLVTLASVHAMKPEIVVLDEVTVGLDRRLTCRLMGWVQRLRRNRNVTVILITHDMRLVAEHAERCVVMQAGQVLATGAPADVFADGEALEVTGLAPPPVFELGRRLGWSTPLLTVADFCDACASQPEGSRRET